jgi:hypothetical protein
MGKRRLKSKVDRCTPVDILHIAFDTGKVESNMAITLFFVCASIETISKPVELLGTK